MNIVALASAYSPTCKQTVVANASNAFTAVPLLIDYDTPEHEVCESQAEARRYLLGGRRR